MAEAGELSHEGSYTQVPQWLYVCTAAGCPPCLSSTPTTRSTSLNWRPRQARQGKRYAELIFRFFPFAGAPVRPGTMDEALGPAPPSPSPWSWSVGAAPRRPQTSRGGEGLWDRGVGNNACLALCTGASLSSSTLHVAGGVTATWGAGVFPFAKIIASYIFTHLSLFPRVPLSSSGSCRNRPASVVSRRLHGQIH